MIENAALDSGSSAGRNANAGQSDEILLDPPEWPKLTDIEVGLFVEAVNTLLDFGIFRPHLAAELVSYRDTANTQMRDRLQSGKKKIRRQDKCGQGGKGKG